MVCFLLKWKESGRKVELSIDGDGDGSCLGDSSGSCLGTRYFAVVHSVIALRIVQWKTTFGRGLKGSRSIAGKMLLNSCFTVQDR